MHLIKDIEAGDCFCLSARNSWNMVTFYNSSLEFVENMKKLLINEEHVYLRVSQRAYTCMHGATVS